MRATALVAWLVVGGCSSSKDMPIQKAPETSPTSAPTVTMSTPGEPLPSPAPTPGPGGPSASAPDVTTEACSHSYLLSSQTKGSYAEHAYPGAMANELAGSVRAAATQPLPLADYTIRTSPTIMVRDGFAAVDCGPELAPYFTSVTFVRSR